MGRAQILGVRGYRLNGSRDLKIVANPRVEWVITYLAFCEVFFLGGCVYTAIGLSL